jgi:hypothetical protein
VIVSEQPFRSDRRKARWRFVEDFTPDVTEIAFMEAQSCKRSPAIRRKQKRVPPMATLEEAELEVKKHLEKNGLRHVPAPGRPTEEIVVLALENNVFLGSVAMSRRYFDRFQASTIAKHLDEKAVASRIRTRMPGAVSPKYVRLDANEDGTPALAPV